MARTTPNLCRGRRSCVRVSVGALLLAVLLGATTVHAGGPLYVAGVSGFNPGVAGTPITWAGGAVNYYTDQGPLSDSVSQPQADAAVADAFTVWTSVVTAAITATRAGQLDEDVSGANVARWSALPPDVQSTSGKAVAVIYDYGGQVLDALLGAGAGADCAGNAVLVRHDGFTPDAHFQHALVIINGNCASAASMPFLRYRLQRAVGRLLGLDWSQTNDNVVSGIPAPTANDYAGFPLMHPEPKLCTMAAGCTYITGRYTAMGYLPAMDDRAAISRLYPVTTAAAGKSLFRDLTARVSGSVRFASWQGAPGAGMQGVNVIATRLDANGARVTAAAASTVSGFLFRGNAGNPVTGTALGEAADRWGSSDPSLQGWYDLGGLEIPAGAASAQYELRVGPVNPAYADARAFGPYGAHTPNPSGSAPAVVITVIPGSDVVQDVVMQDSPAEPRDNREPHSFAEPAALPGGGIWAASLSPYGDADWHWFAPAPGRIFTLDITAVEETGAASERKTLPVAGLWPASAAEGSPPEMQATYFTSGRAGVTRLQGSAGSGGDYRIGIADYRGDGRPDYLYLARLLSISDMQPSRASTGGGTILTLRGTGFTSDVAVSIAGTAASLLSRSADALIVQAPPADDGPQTLTLTDKVTGALATASVVYGAGAEDRIAIIGRAGGPAVPAGAEIEAPIRALITSPDGAPVAGAKVTFSTSSAAVALLPCGGTACTRATDATGEASVSVLVKAADTATIAATLANGAAAYATVVGTPSADAPTLWPSPQTVNLPQGASAAVPLKVRLVSNGVAQRGIAVGFDLFGTGRLSATSATTDMAGDAAITVSFTNLVSEIKVVPYLLSGGPVHSPGLHIFAATAAGQKLQQVAGDAQVASGAFQPVIARVVDSSSPPNPLPGVAVQFQAVAFHPVADGARSGSGDFSLGHFAQRSAVAAVQATVTTDAQGYAVFTPAFTTAYATLDVQVTAQIPTGSIEFNLRRIPVYAIAQAGEQQSNRKAPGAPVRSVQ